MRVYYEYGVTDMLFSLAVLLVFTLTMYLLATRPIKKVKMV
jgi:hypothetical protein